MAFRTRLSPADGDNVDFDTFDHLPAGHFFQNALVFDWNKQSDCDLWHAGLLRITGGLCPRDFHLGCVDEAFHFYQSPFFSAVQMEVHLAVSGGKFGTNGALPSHRVLEPEIEMEMSYRFRQMEVCATGLVFPRVHAFGFQALEIVLVSAEQRRQVEGVRFENIREVVQGFEARMGRRSPTIVALFEIQVAKEPHEPVDDFGRKTVEFVDEQNDRAVEYSYFPVEVIHPFAPCRRLAGFYAECVPEQLGDPLEKVCLGGSVVQNHALHGHASDRKPISVAAFDFFFHLPHQPCFACLPRCPDGEEMSVLALAAYELVYARLDKRTSLCGEMVFFIDGTIGLEPSHGVSPFSNAIAPSA